MVGRQAGHQRDHRVASWCRYAGPDQRRHLRRRRYRGRVFGHAQPARRLRPHRHPVGRYRAADLRRAGTDGRAAGAPCAVAVHPAGAIARNAAVPVANSRLNPAAEDALAAAEGAGEAGQFRVANPDAARAAFENRPLTVRIGYQSPNARLAATVGAIAKACAAAGITVTDAAAESVGPQALRDNRSTCCSPAPAARRQRFDRLPGDGRLRAAHRQRQQPVRLRQ